MKLGCYRNTYCSLVHRHLEQGARDQIPKHCPTGPLLREADLVIAVVYTIPHRHEDASMAASAWETVTVIALLGLLHKF